MIALKRASRSRSSLRAGSLGAIFGQCHSSSQAGANSAAVGASVKAAPIFASNNPARSQRHEHLFGECFWALLPRRKHEFGMLGRLVGAADPSEVWELA